MTKEQYHYGVTIREYREKKGMTQQQLAAAWPKSERFGGGEGVNWKYVQDVEHGRKSLNDIQTIRRICDVLDIPYWKVGLSEYDPFSAQILPHSTSMHTETLEVVESLVRQIWSLRCAARISEAAQGTRRLGEIFAYFWRELPPPLCLEKRFRALYVQYLRLKAVSALEAKDYQATMAIYQEIFSLVKDGEEPALYALSLKSIGKELERKGEKQEAVAYLEEARDAAIDASKLLRAFVQSYLIRVYASSGDLLRFERACATGLTLARSLPGTYQDGDDYIYSWSPVSAILAEQSWGYNELKQPKKTLELRAEIAHELRESQDSRVEAWIPLDWAKAYLQQGEVEQCVMEVREFWSRCKIMGSEHAISHVSKMVKKLEHEGYANIKVVREFRKELKEAQC